MFLVEMSLRFSLAQEIPFSSLVLGMEGEVEASRSEGSHYLR